MHENERQRIIVKEASERALVTVSYLVDLLDASAATIRRDITQLHREGKIRKVRGGAEALRLPTTSPLTGRPFAISQTINAKEKRLVARAAASLCKDGDSIIIGGGSTVFMMAEHLRDHQMQVLTNSFVIAEYLLKNSKCAVNLPAGKIYRDQNLILSPFNEDGTASFYADRLFIGAQGIGALGVMEADPQIVQASSRLLKQAEQRVLVIDSAKFHQRSSMILCPLNEIDLVITDAGVDETSREMLKEHGCELIIADDLITE